MSLEYFISEKDGLSVVTLSGTVGKESGTLLKNCVDEIDQKGTRYVIVHADRLDDIVPEALRIFAVFQKLLRERDRTLRIVGLKNDLRKFLLQQGILYESELRQDLREALQEVKNALRAG